MPKLSQIKYWSIHAAFCASPSFIFACYLGYNRFESIAAMLLAIGCFIVGYATVTSSASYNADPRLKGLRQIAHTAATVRSGISAIGLIGLSLGLMGVNWALYLFLPDCIAGLLATDLTSKLMDAPILMPQFSGGKPIVEPLGFFEFAIIGRGDAFIPTFLSTLFEGIIFTFTLLVIVGLIQVARKLFASSRGFKNMAS